MRWLFFITLYCCSFNVLAEQIEVELIVERDIYQQALALMRGKPPIDVEDFSGPYSSRDTVDYVLAQKAIALGGLDLSYKIVDENYQARNPRLLKHGLQLISFDTLWLSEAKTITSSVFISEPVIRRGEFQAGVFISPENIKASQLASLDDLKQLTAVSNRSWMADWRTLEQIKPARLVHETDWIAMAKMVTNGWVDFMLGAFARKRPFHYSGERYHLVAVEGVKIVLDDSRHFVVSRLHPHGEKTFNALAKGLAILRENGTIERAYIQAGFLNPEVADWVTLNPPE